jgi:predicted metal-dependent hydrolase
MRPSTCHCFEWSQTTYMVECDEDTLLRLRRRVEHWSQKLALRPRVIRLQNMTRKWGSCSTGGTITLAIDLAEREEAFQDVVIVHELLHLKIRSHGRVFRALMTAHVPHWRAPRGAFR